MPQKSVSEFVRTLDMVELWWASNRNRKTLYTPAEIQQATVFLFHRVPLLPHKPTEMFTT